MGNVVVQRELGMGLMVSRRAQGKEQEISKPLPIFFLSAHNPRGQRTRKGLPSGVLEKTSEPHWAKPWEQYKIRGNS